MKQLTLKFILALAFGLGLTLTLLGLMTYLSPGLSVAHAAGPHHVALNCAGIPAPCYTNVQAAVDAAASGDVIKVTAGTYTGVSFRASVTQVVYISKSVTIRGGYTTAFIEPSDPQANPTILNAQGQGRVLYITGAISPTIEGLRITGGSTASTGGGGIYVISATATISNNQIFGNSVGNQDFGGGVFLGSDRSILNANIITGNSAGQGGGGLVLVDSEATLNGNTITSNNACYGGGLDMLYSDGVTLNGNIIANNTADNTIYPLCWSDFSVGGGLLLDFNSDATLINNLITDNQLNDQANSQGSGLYIRASSPQLLHTTIAGNTGGDGSGIFITEYTDISGTTRSNIALTNTILVSQTVGITVTAGNTANLKSTSWNGNITNWGGPGTVNTSNNYTGNPAFVNPNSGNYHLDPTSAAIDKGVNAGVTSDIDGEIRPQGAAPDLGADEHPATPLLSINKSGPSTTTIGSLITYTLTITNSGLITATNLVITDTIPAGAHYISGGTKVGNVVSWTVPSLAANGGVTQTTFVVTATQTITNSDYGVQADGGYSAQGHTNAVTLIDNALVVDFTAAPLTGTSPLQVYFTNNSLNATGYYWNFGDGAFSSARNPAHTYTQPGPYTVTLTASTATTSSTVTQTNYITVYEVPITGLAVTNSSPTELDDATRFTATVMAGSNVGYTWAFGDGATGSGAVVTHTYPATGSYTTIITARNSVTTATVTTTVSVIDNPIWYVSPTGNDSNICLSPTEPCRTITVAVQKATSGNTIMLAPGRYIENVTISGKNLILKGSGVDSTIVDGNKAGRVFIINLNAHVTISNMSITNGNGGIHVNGTDTVLTLNNSAVHNNSSTQNGGGLSISFSTVFVNNSIISSNSAPNGGGVFVQPSNGNALLKVSNSTISHNTTTNTGAGNGGGIFSWRTVILVNSTISYNNANSNGGGVFNSGSGAFLTLSNSTISHNRANGTAGGIVTPFYSTLTLKNSVLASQDSGNNCENGGSINSLGYNLDSDGSCALTASGDRANMDPLLGPLQSNGGSTPTQALLPGSPVIDLIPLSHCTDYMGVAIATDQRGQVRPVDGDGDGYAACDMGAYEATGNESMLVLQVNPIALSFSATQGGGNPTAQSFSISNLGAGALNWTASENLSWLNLSSLSGTTPATVAVSVNTGGLNSGVYTGSITISSSDALGSPQVIDVTLTVNPPAPSPLNLNAEAGHTNIKLVWNPTNDPNVTAYRVSRAVMSSTLTAIALISNTVYFDADPSLVAGTTYCYQVAALRANSSVVVTSNTTCAPFGQVALWIPDTWAAPGQTAIVPVNIRNATGLRLAASDIWLDFDRTVVEPLNIQATPLSAGYQWSYSLSDFSGYSRARISVIADSSPLLQGDGSLFWLVVRVVGAGGAETSLNLREFINGVGGSTIYTPADLFNPIPLNLQDGTFRVANAYILGDLNGNGVVEAVDAYIALQIASHKLTPTSQQLYAGDVNGNGEVDAADASMIFYYAVHGNWPPLPVAGSSLQTAAGSVYLNLDDVSGQPGSIAITTLRAQHLSDWAGGKFIIAYDSALVESITNVTATDLALSFPVQFHDDGAGLLYIALADDVPVNGSGALATISLRIAPGAAAGSHAPLTLAEAHLNDLSGRDFATSALQQIIQRDNGEVQVGAGQPGQIYLPIIIK